MDIQTRRRNAFGIVCGLATLFVAALIAVPLFAQSPLNPRFQNVTTRGLTVGNNGTLMQQVNVARISVEDGQTSRSIVLTGALPSWNVVATVQDSSTTATLRAATTTTNTLTVFLNQAAHGDVEIDAIVIRGGD